MKKLIKIIRLRLAYWHKNRYNKLLAKALGCERYYRYRKSMLNSIYGMSVNDMTHMYEAFNLGRTHCDNSSMYPRVMKEIYKDTDSIR